MQRFCLGFYFLKLKKNFLLIKKKTQAAPYAHLGDGKFDILYTTEEASKPDLAIYLLSMEDETPNVSTVNYRKGRAVMLESFQSEKGRFALDGELVSYEPIRSFVVPQLIKLLSPPF